MNTTVSALLDLYVKLGGLLTDSYDDIADGTAVGDYTKIPDCVEACAKKASSGGGGGNAPIIVTAEIDVTTGEITNASATLSDVVEAVDDGKDVLLVISSDLEYGTAYRVFTSTSVLNGENAKMAEFSMVYSDNDEGIVIASVYADSSTDDGAWKSKSTVIVPAYSAADSGKVLSVDSNGELAWVTP